MKKQRRIPAATVWIVVLLAGAALVSAATTTTGTISKVTVYRGQALVTRTIDVDLPQGPSELIVSDLPGQILPESLYAQTSGNVKVMSVRYRERAVREDTREEVKQLDKEIENVKHRLKHLESDHTHFARQWNMFEKLKDFTSSAAKSDLERGLLTFEPIKQLTGLIEDKGIEYHRRALELVDEVEQLEKELELLNRKRSKLTEGRSRTEREAILFIGRNGSGKANIELSYLVNRANWRQQYNLRANPGKTNVLIEYNAVVNQTSGEDWDGVSLSLSTAEPTIVAEPPILEPMFVGLSRSAQVQGGRLQPLDQSEHVLRQQRARRSNIKMGKGANQELNIIATDNQFFLLNASKQQVEDFREQLAEVARNEGVSVTYNLPGRLSLGSRSDQQLVTIAGITAKAEFTLVATPLLTDYVYLQGELLNDSDTVLLPGEASMFRNGEFVGRGNVPLVTTGERFTTGFGIDSQVQVTHELEDKQTRIQGGNRIDTYHYRIALNNYNSSAMGLRLLDRLPYSKDSAIKIELLESSSVLSDEAEYVRTARKKGILRWDLQLAGDTTGEKATVVKYSFTMEYDRNMQIRSRQDNQ